MTWFAPFQDASLFWNLMYWTEQSYKNNKAFIQKWLFTNLLTISNSERSLFPVKKSVGEKSMIFHEKEKQTAICFK